MLPIAVSVRRSIPAILVLALAATAGAATVSGRVQVAEKGGPRADASKVVVWIDGVAPAKGKREGKPPEMTSKNKKFEPGVMVVPVGAEVSFPNVDPIFHNVFSVSGENRFDLGLYKGGASKSTKFTKPGLVRVYCNIHSSMVGFIHVLESPFWAITDPSGAFEIKGVPPGKYTLRWWEEKAGEGSRELVVAEGGPPVTIDVDARGFVAKPHLNKYGKTYEKKGDDDERY